MRHAALLLILAFLAAPFLSAQTSPDADNPAVQSASAEGSGPVPVPQPSEKAMRYYRSGNLLWVVGTLWGLAVPALLLFTGFSARMRDVARRIGRNWFFTVAIYAVLFTLVAFILDLPLAWYMGFVRQHEYGLSSQAAAKWWGDALKGLAIGCVFSALFLWLPYLLLRKSPRRWWLYTGLLAVPLIVLMLLVTPIWVEPLFNDFGPMKDKALESRILALADRSGIEGSRVFEVEKSVDTKTVNAYVTGFMNTKRIVLWDTLLGKLDDEEVLVVMGHEMGHYVLGHVAQIIVLASALVLVGLWVIHKTAGSLIARYRDRFGFTELSDVASVPSDGPALQPREPPAVARAAGRLAAQRARVRPLRVGDHPQQPRLRRGVREAAAGEPGQSSSRAPLQDLALLPSAAGRAHRLLQRIPALGGGPAVEV